MKIIQVRPARPERAARVAERSIIRAAPLLVDGTLEPVMVADPETVCEGNVSVTETISQNCCARDSALASWSGHWLETQLTVAFRKLALAQKQASLVIEEQLAWDTEDCKQLTTHGEMFPRVGNADADVEVDVEVVAVAFTAVPLTMVAVAVPLAESVTVALAGKVVVALVVVVPV